MTDGMGLALLRDVQSLKKKRSISVGTIVTKNDHISIAHNCTTAQAERSEILPCTKKKIPLVPQVHTVDIPGKAIRPHG